LSIFIYIYIYNNNNNNVVTNGKTEAQAMFLNSFAVCSLCKQKFVIRPFVEEETNGSFPFTNGLNGLMDLLTRGN
jgi:hypothetical protein